MVGYGISTNKDKEGSLKFMFDLERIQFQPSMGQARRRPLAEEMDDWKTYKREKEVHGVKDSSLIDPNEVFIMPRGLRGGEAMVSRRGSGCSPGYHGRRSATSRSTDSEGSKEKLMPF